MRDFMIQKNFALAMVSVSLLLCIACGCGKTPVASNVKEVTASTSDSIEDVAEIQAGDLDWPNWRGPNFDDSAPNASVPTSWSPTSGITWKTKVPGRGHACPIVYGNQIFLSTADEDAETQSVLAFDKSTGDKLWEKKLFAGNFEQSMHPKNTQATCTIACDGERLFASFLNDQKIHVVALDLAGEELWRKTLGGFDSKFGYSASPFLYKQFVIIAADHQSGGYVASLHRKSGDIHWLKKRGNATSQASPVVWNTSGKEQLLVPGIRELVSYDPLTGEENWKVNGLASTCVGTVVAQNDMVVASGGYPQSVTMCVKTDGSGDIVWQNNVKFYVTSLSIHDGHVYGVNDKGIAYCWDLATGNEQWKQRVGENHSASIVRAGDIFIACSENGKVTMFKANPDKYKQVSEQRLGDEIFATPAISGNQIYFRVADQSSGPRQEYLYCIGEPETKDSDVQSMNSFRRST